MAINQSKKRGPRTRMRATAKLNAGRETPAILGSWELGDLAGTGSCANAFYARPANSARTTSFDYVVKVLKREFRDSPEVIETFRREAMAGRSVSHPHLLPVLMSCVKRPPYFLVVPRISGITIGHALRQAGHFSLAHAVWYTRQVAEAIAELHRNCWLHGDVKPDNIFVTIGGHATLFDLGFASHPKHAAHNSKRLLRGTLAYAAPELFTSTHRAGPASDVYSLGISLHEQLTGKLPFAHSANARLIEAHLREVPPSPKTDLPHIPRSICSLLKSMLAKDPLRRPHSVDELVPELIRLEIDVLAMRAA